MFVTNKIVKIEENEFVSIPLPGQYVCNQELRVAGRATLKVSIPLPGQYVCNFTIIEKIIKIDEESQSPCRVNMFVTFDLEDKKKNALSLNPLAGSICL